MYYRQKKLEPYVVLLVNTRRCGCTWFPPPQSRHGVGYMSYENLVLGQSKDQEQKSAHQGRRGALGKFEHVGSSLRGQTGRGTRRREERIGDVQKYK